MNIILRSVGLFGVMLFGILFSITFLSPESIEHSAKGFVKHQIEKEVQEKRQDVSESNVAKQALSIAEKLGLESDKIKQDLENNIPQKIASIIASMCGYDCERQKALAQSITTGYLERIKSINIAHATLGDLVRGKYIEIVGNLKLDLRIFLGSNLLMFFALLILSFAKPKAVVHLFLPAMLLVLATVVSSSIYIYGQDWFYTILYNDYMGFGYLAYILLIFGELVDISLNKARVTTEVVNGIASALGTGFSVISC